MRKWWVSVKRGFIVDPKHRAQMAERVWLYLYMLDLAHWETGKIFDWTDESASDELRMDIRTLRDQRQKLARDGYIICKKKQRGQEIAIVNWTNPREYTGAVYNQSDTPVALSEDAQSDTPGSTQVQSDTPCDTPSDTASDSGNVTPTSNSKDKSQNSGGSGLSEEDYRKANLAVDVQLGKGLKFGPRYAHREKFPEVLVPYADEFVKTANVRPDKKSLTDWIATFSSMQAYGITVDDMAKAIVKLRKNGIDVARPGSTELTAKAMMGRRLSTTVLGEESTLL